MYITAVDGRLALEYIAAAGSVGIRQVLIKSTKKLHKTVPWEMVFSFGPFRTVANGEFAPPNGSITQLPVDCT